MVSDFQVKPDGKDAAGEVIFSHAAAVSWMAVWSADAGLTWQEDEQLGKGTAGICPCVNETAVDADGAMVFSSWDVRGRVQVQLKQAERLTGSWDEDGQEAPQMKY